MIYEQARAAIDNAKQMQRLQIPIWKLLVSANCSEIPPFPGGFHDQPYNGTIHEEFTGPSDYITRVSDYLAQHGFTCEIKPYTHF